MSTRLSRSEFNSILRSLIRFAVPLILGGVFSQLYSWADAFIVGNVEGEITLGAIAGTGTVTGFFIMFAFGFTTGLAVLAGQKFGSGDHAFLRSLLHTYAIAVGVLIVLVTAAAMVLARLFLQLIHTPLDTIDLAASYLHITLIALPSLTLYYVYSAVLRGVGDSRAPFLSSCISSGANVVLDILFVAVFRWGIRGAAIATVISQIAMMVFLIPYTYYKHPELGGGSFSREALGQGLHFGIPPMIQSCVTALGNLVLQDFMNGFGTSTVVAITTAYRIDSMAMLPVVNLGSAISTLTAQRFGAGETERPRRCAGPALC